MVVERLTLVRVVRNISESSHIVNCSLSMDVGVHPIQRECFLANDKTVDHVVRECFFHKSFPLYGI